MERLARIVTKKPMVNIVIIFCLTLFLGWQMTRVTMDNDVKSMLPQDDPVIKLDNEVAKVFGLNMNQAVIGIVADDVFTPTTLAKVERIVRAVKAIKGVDVNQVVGLPTLEEIKGTESGFEARKLWPGTPMSAEQAARLKDTVLANELYAGSVVAKDGTATMIVAQFASDVQINETYALLKAIATREEGPERIHLGGMLVVNAVLDIYAQKVGLLLVFAVLAIVAILFWSFRSLRGVIIPLTTATLSTVWVFGLMGLLRVPMDTFTLQLPILILAIGSGHSVQVVKRYYELIASGMDKPAAVRGAVARAGLAMTTAGLTSAAGFASLATFSLRSIQVFGIFTAVGILSVLALELTFIPAWQMLLPAPRKKPANGKGLDRVLANLGSRLTRKPAVALVAAVVVAIASLVGMRQLKVEGNLLTMLRPQSEVRVDARILGEKFGGSDVLYVIVKGQAPDAIKDPAVLRYIAELQSYAKTIPGVGNAASIADYIRTLNKAMNGDDPEFSRIPQTQELVAQYLLLASMSTNTKSLDSLVDYDYQTANLTLTLKESSTSKTAAVIEAVKSHIAERPLSGVSVQFAGSSVVMQRVNDIMVEEKILNILQTAGIIFVFCAFIFRSLVGALFAILPLSVAVLLNFGLMGWFGMPLDLATATISGMAIGIGADYALYYLLRHRQEHVLPTDRRGGAGAEVPAGPHGHAAAAIASMKTTGRAILTTAFAITAGFLSLIFSDFGAHQTMGLLVAISMMASSLGALFILPAAAALFKPRFAGRAAPWATFWPLTRKGGGPAENDGKKTTSFPGTNRLPQGIPDKTGL